MLPPRLPALGGGREGCRAGCRGRKAFPKKADADIHAGQSGERGAGQATKKSEHEKEDLQTLRKRSVKKALLEENFSNWTKREINMLIRAYEQSGHTDIKAIAKAKFRVLGF